MTLQKSQFYSVFYEHFIFSFHIRNVAILKMKGEKV